jgi:monoterpene epsilon-lactone hydrolase
MSRPRAQRLLPFSLNTGTGRAKAVWVLCLLVGATASWRASAQATSAAPPAPAVKVAADGTVTIPQETVPVSTLLSPEAKAYVAQHLKDMQDPSATYAEKGIPRFMLPYLAEQKAMFAVEQQDTKIDGVHVVVFTPKQGIAAENAKRVLINLHGGGFSGCWPGCSLLESIPIASVGGFKVVSVDYRQGPDYHFPAASEDVAKVYAALLKEYPAQNVGIYGCSAGGGLTAMSVAWFQKHDLPAPGAIGIFCAGAGGFSGGDAAYITWPIGEARMPRTTGASLPPLGYFKDTDPNDPLIAPVMHPDVLAKFPPTLIITGTRDFALSNAINTNIQLTKAGVDSKLYVWDGLFHGFFYNPGVPESMDAYKIICQFFTRELGK